MWFAHCWRATTRDLIPIVWLVKQTLTDLDVLLHVYLFLRGENFTIRRRNKYVHCNLKIERDNPYHFFPANQQKAGTKIYSLTQCSFTVNECGCHILACNDEKINTHCFTRDMKLSEWEIYKLLNISSGSSNNIGSATDNMDTASSPVKYNLWLNYLLIYNCNQGSGNKMVLADIDGDRNIDAICQHACEESGIEIVLNINSIKGKCFC